MTKRIKILLAAVISVLLLLMSFGAGCVISLGNSPKVCLNTDLLNQAWSIIHRNFVEQDKIDSAALNEGAIRGMVQALDDPYTYYLNADEYQLTQGNFQSSFGGIGATISVNDDEQPIIVNTISGSPAEEAGILPGDIILAVNDDSTDGLTVAEVVLLVRGPKGTAVKLTVFHEGQDTPVVLEVVRAEINPTTVEYHMERDIAYIQITNFYERTNTELETVLKAIDMENTQGIIIDLRNNLGGYANVLVDVAGHFVKEGTIIIVQDNQGQRTSINTKPSDVFTDLPMVVLVNEYSASASEVFSGAMQDYERAVIAGTVTFGKGSYDAFYNLSDGSAIYLTIGRWLTPDGREIERVGITPDYILTETDEDAIRWAVDYLHNQ